jgi:hypothetical protein
MAYWLRSAGYIVGAIALLWNIVLVMASMGMSYGAWDYLLPIALVLIPLISLALATKWLLVAGEALIAAGLFVGAATIGLNTWVAMFYGLPVVVTGLIFVSAWILLSIKQTSYQ